MAYCDAGLLLVGFFAAQTTGVRYCTELPASFEDDLPVVRFQRVSGGDAADHPTLDIAVVDVDAFGADLAAVTATAKATHSIFRHVLPKTPWLAQTVGRVETVNGFRPLPWDDTQIRRLSATYTLYVATFVS